MTDELNVPTHRWYQARNHIKLPPNAVSKKWIYANGVALIDAWINSQPWGNPVPALFAAGEPGAWYDPSDLSTMFQDSAGTTPVTAAGQPVGLRLDKSKGLVLGPELVTNGTFGANITGWSNTGASTSVWESGAARWSTAWAEFAGFRSASFATVVGRTYEFTATVLENTGAAWRIVFVNGDGSYSNGTGNYTTPGTRTARFIATQTTSFVEIRNGTAATANRLIDNISVRELPGFHATQSTAASRPTYGVVPSRGRVNLLTFTEDFSSASWPGFSGWSATTSTITATGGASSTRQSFTGAVSGSTYTVSVDLLKISGAITQLFFDIGDGPTQTVDLPTSSATRVSLQLVAGSSGSFLDIRANDAGSFSIGKIQLETGSTATAYQKVVSQYEVTEAGKPTLHYVQYDGVDDFLVTPTITPGTDKVQVFAGVRKLSDAATSIAVELSATTDTNNGAFALFAPSAAGANKYRYFSRGTSNAFADATSTSFNAPITSVLTAIGDIAADTAILRINGAQINQSAADQGTGNYLAYPLYIGRRGGTSLPFNGRDYGLIVRFGPNLSTAQIASVEDWLNTRTGAY